MIETLFSRFTFGQHLLIAFAIRTFLIIYGELQDDFLEVPYTDVDYKVVTDGARYILENESPFNRHTYRYSPIFAYLMVPNVLLHKSYGKFLFSLFDLLVAIIIKKIVSNELKITFFQTTEVLLRKHKEHTGANMKTIDQFQFPKKYKDWAKTAAYCWLYNPLTAVISTRGNGDSFSILFVLATIYLIQKPSNTVLQYFAAGIMHGLAIHLRIYPLIFSLAYFLSLSENKFRRFTDYYLAIVRPNTKQFMLVTGTVLTLFFVNNFFYDMYGYKYIYEVLLYHLVRKDTRHNFSLYFLMQYLGTDSPLAAAEQILKFLPQAVLLFYFSVTFGVYRKTLSFCIFAQTFVFVIYNPVMTSQYFVWFLSILPLCLKNLRNIQMKLACSYFCVWMLAQGMWLLPAYLLEFRSWNTFDLLGIQSIGFFFVNIFILQHLIDKLDVLSNIK